MRSCSAEIEARTRRRRDALVQQRLEAVRIVAGGELVRTEVLDDALDRFAVALDRRRLAEALAIARSHANQSRARDRLLAARDLERVAQRQVERVHGQRQHDARFPPDDAPSSAAERSLTGGVTVEGLDCV